ncbi:hypothetical protein IE81DRAFT_326963 [Ceraceosorus guamensis]|uniref:Uncharacterized protein n=1 Tax=Ceraceosorus guamensis TaxID=1522189 RepID=A0A316VN13_9BASI|nr:hypothetical protein IE81DRAFT_326963 [Ceraceosorus guamensis]PWN39019.1 hypothetical protein IE81DRAFT_326963 [Ceraceosorus guamensis]
MTPVSTSDGAGEQSQVTSGMQAAQNPMKVKTEEAVGVSNSSRSQTVDVTEAAGVATSPSGSVKGKTSVARTAAEDGAKSAPKSQEEQSLGDEKGSAPAEPSASPKNAMPTLPAPAKLMACSKPATLPALTTPDPTPVRGWIGTVFHTSKLKEPGPKLLSFLRDASSAPHVAENRTLCFEMNISPDVTNEDPVRHAIYRHYWQHLEKWKPQKAPHVTILGIHYERTVHVKFHSSAQYQAARQAGKPSFGGRKFKRTAVGLDLPDGHFMVRISDFYDSQGADDWTALTQSLISHLKQVVVIHQIWCEVESIPEWNILKRPAGVILLLVEARRAMGESAMSDAAASVKKKGAWKWRSKSYPLHVPHPIRRGDRW